MVDDTRHDWWMTLGMIKHVFPCSLFFTPSVAELNVAKVFHCIKCVIILHVQLIT